MKNELHLRLIHYLETHKLNYESLSHPSAQTCQEAANLRGASLSIGGKTLLIKTSKQSHTPEEYFLFTLAADRNLDSKRVRKILGTHKMRFANAQDLFKIAGVEKGALPPFGRPLLPLDLYLDESILENELIAFNSGLTTHSIILRTEDYLKLVQPKINQFSK